MSKSFLLNSNYLRAPTSEDYRTLSSWVRDPPTWLKWAGSSVVFPFTAEDLPGLLMKPGCEDRSYILTDCSGCSYGFGQHWIIQSGAVHVGRIIVSPELRGKGYGRVLCELLIKSALTATNANKVTLRVFRDNYEAFYLYSCLGFVIDTTLSDDTMFFMYLPTAPQAD